MRPRRIYLPLSHDQVRALARDKVLAAPIHGFAAGPPSRVDARLTPAAAEEEVEYAAFAAAAERAVETAPAHRRVIASADAPSSAVDEQPGAPDGTVGIVTTAELPLRHFVSLHIDEDSSGPAGALELLWYDITELDVVVADLG